ncbi:MAG TPA: hypothetical protein VFB84_17115, partial [Micromonosporaceae bacterium]|nr:hypothetical protein [Micromonosporaceae bacterium]
GSYATNPLPLPATEVGPVWLVPTQTRSLTVEQTSTVPADFDLAPVNNGIPELYGVPSATGLTASASVHADRVTHGIWNAVSTPLGPTNGPVSGSTTLRARARTEALDPTVTSTTGNAMYFAVGVPVPFTPLFLLPGQSGTITATVTPTGPVGSTVSGVIYVETFAAFYLGQSTVDEVAAVPYSYTVG